MANSSPEYAITKSGLHHPLRKRDKPLRTYGRRSVACESNAEPPSKKPRLGGTETKIQENPCPLITTKDDRLISDSSSLENKTTTASPCNACPVQAQVNAKKGSIMSYFKPAPSRQQTSPSPQSTKAPSEIPEEPTIQSVSSTATRRKKTRLLKIRATSVPNDSADTSEGEEKENKPIGDNGDLMSSAPSTSNYDDIRTRRGLLGRSEDTKPSRSAKSKTSSSVQTTLNISAKAAFSECKICDTVWNPLYPDDVKYHTKIHKTVLRARMKKVDDEL